jgi:hypothetical protein
MTNKKRDVVIPPKQLEIVRKHFNKLQEMQEKIKHQQDQLADVFTLLDSVYNTQLASGNDTINPDGAINFGPRPDEEKDIPDHPEKMN